MKEGTAVKPTEVKKEVASQGNQQSNIVDLAAKTFLSERETVSLYPETCCSSCENNE